MRTYEIRQTDGTVWTRFEAEDPIAARAMIGVSQSLPQTTSSLVLVADARSGRDIELCYYPAARLVTAWNAVTSDRGRITPLVASGLAFFF